MAAARAIDRGDEADLDTQRARILLADARIKHLTRMLDHSRRAGALHVI